MLLRSVSDKKYKRLLGLLVLSVCSLLPLLLVRQGEPLEDGLLPLPFVPEEVPPKGEESEPGAAGEANCSLNL